VELVVVITILAILGTIGFLSIQNYSAKARDSVRISDMSNVIKAFALFKAQNDTYPVPENSLALLDGLGSVISYQGNLGESIMRQVKMDKVAVDPKDRRPYVYSIDSKRKKVQLMGYLEHGDAIRVLSFLDPISIAYASDYSDRHIYVTGDQVGILTDATKAPLQDTYTGTGVDLRSINTAGITAYFGGDVYGGGKSTGTGDVLITQLLGAVNDAIPCNSAAYNGYAVSALTHKQTGTFSKPLTISQGSGTGTLRITCLNGSLDMVNSVETLSVSCNSGYMNTGNNLCASNICGGSMPANSEVLSGTTQNVGQNWTKGTGVVGVCTFECKTNYTWNSSVCAANTQMATACNGSVATYATSNSTATTWTQTWNGSAWLPVYTFTRNSVPGICTFECNAGYAWNGSICSFNSYAVSGSFGANANGATVNVCGTNVTADASGNFSRSGVPHGTACNAIAATRTGYTCSTTTNGPASLTSNVSNVSGSCADVTAPT
jgi:type II secretory pathway pseudopilin PulG